MNQGLGYVVSWFPAPTETFILYELTELQRQGLRPAVFPLFGARSNVVHPGVDRVLPYTHYVSRSLYGLLAAQLYWLLTAPRAYLGAWTWALRGTFPSSGMWIRTFAVVPLAAAIAREVQRRGIQHLHAHWATHPTLAAAIVARLTGATYSFTAHAHDLYVDQTLLAEKVAGARFVAAISRFNARLLARHADAAARRRIHVVPCGVDSRVFNPERRRRRPGPALTIACVAALRDYKGHRYLLDACAELRRRGVRFRLVLVGDGPERAHVEAHLRALELTEHVELRGMCPASEVVSLLHEADVLALASIVTDRGMMEGIPVCLMEGMAAGLPVVATDVSGVSELVLDSLTGLLVPPRDAGALADALQRLSLDPPLRQALGRAARAHVRAYFDRTRNVRRLAELLVETRTRKKPDPRTGTGTTVSPRRPSPPGEHPPN